MNGVAPAKFNLRGQFAGFFRDIFGNYQMVLRNSEGELFLEVSKALRRELEISLVVGREVVAIGEMSVTGESGRRRRIVSQVQPAEKAAACVACPIRVCANKTCWRNGGQALWRDLEEKIASAGLSDRVKLKAVPCMDQCKQGPNVEVGGYEYHRCSLSTADEILAPFFDQQVVNKNENACSTAGSVVYDSVV